MKKLMTDVLAVRPKILAALAGDSCREFSDASPISPTKGCYLPAEHPPFLVHRVNEIRNRRRSGSSPAFSWAKNDPGLRLVRMVVC